MPRSVDGDERRQELTDAAARLIARSGIAAATLRAVAAEAGVSTGALTHYFVDKRELLLATLNASLDQRRHRREAGEPTDPLAALRAALVVALPVDADSRRHWTVTVAFCAEAAGDPELARAQRDAYRGYRTTVARLVATAAPGADALRVAERLIGAADGVALQALWDPASWPARRQLEGLDDAMATIVG